MAINPSYPISSGRLVGSTIINGQRVPEVVQRPAPGISRSIGNEVAVDVSTANTDHALVGIRAQPGEEGLVITLTFASVIATTNDKYEWRLWLNPVVNGEFSFEPLFDSRIEAAIADDTNTITGGTILLRGFGEGQSVAQAQFINELEVGPFGAELVLGVRSFTNNADFRGALSWRELV